MWYLSMTNDQISAGRRTDCPCCGAMDVYVFHEVNHVPVNTVMNIYSREAALSFPHGDIDLGFCKRCGFIFNTRFDRDAVRYSTDCEESQAYSPTFSAFARELAQDLVEKYRVHNKTIIEIGCGKGGFLKHICALGDNRGIGFDPAYVAGRSDGADADAKVTFINDFFSDKYADVSGDLVCCIMTLEHISDPAELIQAVYHAVSDRPHAVVVFQVPDVTRILKDCCFEDVYYEHCAYYSPFSLSRLFQRFGFDILDLKTVYDGQYILLEARAAKNSRPVAQAAGQIDSLNRLVDDFNGRYPQLLRHWQNRLNGYRRQSRKVVIWGGGSKGAAFLHAVDGSDLIRYVVDINPHRQQTYMAGSGQRIVDPGFLQQYRPDAVIIMNAIYRKEITADLQRLGLAPEVITLNPDIAYEPNGG